MSSTRASAADSSTQANPDSATPTVQRKIPLFFYGTLQNPKFLVSLLSLSKTPSLTRATLYGYKLKTWSAYPIVVPQEGSVVEGMLWEEGATEEHFNCLERYEGYAYTWAETEVEVRSTEGGENGNGEVVKKKGVRVFVASDPESDEIREGTRSPEEWRKIWGDEN